MLHALFCINPSVVAAIAIAWKQCVRTGMFSIAFALFVDTVVKDGKFVK
jgi:hypothetical protein